MSSTSPPGNQGPCHTLSVLVSSNQLSATGQAQGGPSEPPQNSSNLDTDQISAGWAFDSPPSPSFPHRPRPFSLFLRTRGIRMNAPSRARWNHLILKVGCGHVCEIKPILGRSRSNSCQGTSSCRYQMSYDAILSDPLTITYFLRFVSPLLPLHEARTDTLCFRRLPLPVLPLYSLHKRKRRRGRRRNHGGGRLVLQIPPNSSL